MITAIIEKQDEKSKIIILRCGLCRAKLPSKEEARKQKLVSGNTIKCNKCQEFNILPK